MTGIIHISDLHFASTELGILTPTAALRKAADAIERHHSASEAMDLVISGDVTTKGASIGYDAAAAALMDFRKRIKIRRILVAPGNHDISLKKNFNDFNRFAFNLTGDTRQMYSTESPVIRVPTETIEYVLVNTAYHLDHQYGEVPMQEFGRALGESDAENSVIVVHHSPIASKYGGNAISNSYDFLAAAAGERVMAVLHGHIHGRQTLPIGRRPTMLLGTGSLGFKPDPNMNNQFAVHIVRNNSVSSVQFVYEADRDHFRPHEVGAR